MDGVLDHVSWIHRLLQAAGNALHRGTATWRCDGKVVNIKNETLNGSDTWAKKEKNYVSIPTASWIVQINLSNVAKNIKYIKINIIPPSGIFIIKARVYDKGRTTHWTKWEGKMTKGGINWLQNKWKNTKQHSEIAIISKSNGNINICIFYTMLQMNWNT